MLFNYALRIAGASIVAACPLLAAATVLAPAKASAAEGAWDFQAVPETDLNRVFRVNRATGEMGACQFGLDDKTAAKGRAVGVTLCYAPGEGAGPQTPSEYRLIASHHDREAGIYRVDVRSGAMSICYVLDDAVVCTPLTK